MCGRRKQRNNLILIVPMLFLLHALLLILILIAGCHESPCYINITKYGRDDGDGQAFAIAVRDKVSVFLLSPSRSSTVHGAET